MGLHIRKLRSEQQIIVLEKGEVWSFDEINKLAAKFHTICHHPKFPSTLMFPKEMMKNEEDVSKTLGHNNFQMKVIQGMDNEELPFHPQFI